MLKRPGEPHEFLPLRPVDFHLLVALTEGESHGYRLVKKIEDGSEGRVRLEPGNLYRHLRRLVDDGLVSPAPARADEERRRYYRITPLGRLVLAAEADRMRALVRAVDRMRASGESGA